MADGIPYTRAVEIARQRGFIQVNLYDERPITKAVKRAEKKGLLMRSGRPKRAARFILTQDGGMPHG